MIESNTFDTIYNATPDRLNLMQKYGFMSYLKVKEINLKQEITYDILNFDLSGSTTLISTQLAEGLRNQQITGIQISQTTFQYEITK